MFSACHPFWEFCLFGKQGQQVLNQLHTFLGRGAYAWAQSWQSTSFNAVNCSVNVTSLMMIKRVKYRYLESKNLQRKINIRILKKENLILLLKAPYLIIWASCLLSANIGICPAACRPKKSSDFSDKDFQHVSIERLEQPLSPTIVQSPRWFFAGLSNDRSTGSYDRPIWASN